MPLLAPGDKAPEFTLTATGGSRVTLSDLRGRRVLLYFYPRDDTPGCTIEACGFRDSLGDLTARGVDVLGINDDDVDSHQRFTAKYDLNFPLLADPDHGVIEAYGAWVQKQIRGRSVNVRRSGDLSHRPRRCRRARLAGSGSKHPCGRDRRSAGCEGRSPASSVTPASGLARRTRYDQQSAASRRQRPATALGPHSSVGRARSW